MTIADIAFYFRFLFIIAEGVSAPWTASAFALQQAAEPSRAVFGVPISLSWITDALAQPALDLLGKQATQKKFFLHR